MTESSNTEILSIEAELVPTGNTPLVPLVVNNIPTDARADYEFARSNYYDIMSKGGMALERLVEIADSSQNRSDYRVIGELITALTNTNDKLLEMHRKKKDLGQDMEKNSSGPTNVNIDKAVFTTAADLLDMVIEHTKTKE